MFGGAQITSRRRAQRHRRRRQRADEDLPWRGTSWTVKNLFELKHARRVLVRRNLMVTTGRGPARIRRRLHAPQLRRPHAVGVSEDVEFSVERDPLGQLGLQYPRPRRHRTSGQLARLLIKNNLAYDIHAGNWGGTGTFAQLGGEPRDVTIDHNTVLHPATSCRSTLASTSTPAARAVTGGPIARLQFTNNMGKHNGLRDFRQRQELRALDSAWRSTRQARGAAGTCLASRYVSWRRVIRPTISSRASSNFNAGFVDPPPRDYRLVSASPYVDAGTDGQDIGAAIPD